MVTTSAPRAALAVTPLADSFGRVATDLRVSLTDRCNLRCTYCMPAEGLPWLPPPELLTDDEVVRLVDIAVTRLGVTQIRLTGGEPTLRPGLPGLVERLAALRPRPEISLTTNGLSLARLAPALAAAGLDRVNVSLDTLRRDRFTELTRRDRLPDVIRGLEAAAAAGLTPVKINAVLMRGVNDDEAPDLLEYALAAGYELRFIEQMPLDPQHGWDRSKMVTADENPRRHRAPLPPGGGARPRERAGGDVLHRRRPGPGRHHRERHRTLLRQLRPGAAHRRRTGARLPVRADGIRPSYGVALRCHGRGAGGPVGGGDARQARGPRHRRPDLPAAAAAHVGHRGMSFAGGPGGRAFDAIVLAGGASRRMGGGDKTALEVGGVSLLERALRAVGGANSVVVVGAPRPVPMPVCWAREDPEGAGPAAALAAGLPHTSSAVVVTLAADLPFVTAATIGRLVRAADPHGAVLVDAGRRAQWLLAAWPRDLLSGALAGDQTGRSLRGAYARLTPALVAAEGPREWLDCDEPADLQHAREIAP